MHGRFQVLLRLNFTVRDFGVRGVQSPHGVGVGKDLYGFFEGLEVFRRQENSRRLPVHGHVDALVLATDLSDQPGQVRLRIGQRKRRHGQKYDQNGGALSSCDGAGVRPQGPTVRTL
jgi:hypothetical protein